MVNTSLQVKYTIAIRKVFMVTHGSWRPEYTCAETDPGVESIGRYIIWVLQAGFRSARALTPINTPNLQQSLILQIL